MIKFLQVSTLLIMALQIVPWQASFSSPLTIISQKQRAVLTNKQLHSLRLEMLEMDYSRAYPNQKMTYETIRLCDLLKSYEIKPSNVLEFVAEDHFSVLVPAKKVLDCKKNASIAYLAIEPNKKWPILFNHTNTSAGPYAVIWTHPERSYISDEYWAWSVVKIIEHQAIDESIVISPPSNLTKKNKKRVLNGYRIYVSHCSSCHTINHIGKATIGLDLTQPKTIFAYYPDKNKLKQFIRNPESVRKIPNGRMSGSSYAGLNDSDLEDLIYYFEFVVNKKHT